MNDTLRQTGLAAIKGLRRRDELPAMELSDAVIEAIGRAVVSAVGIQTPEVIAAMVKRNERCLAWICRDTLCADHWN